MKGKRTLLISCSVILLCVSIIVGMTYALFTDKATYNHHLKAGTLDITLERVSLRTTSLNLTTGFLETKSTSPTDPPVDFSNTDKNVFDIDSNTLFVPGCEYTAAMKISNESDVAFAYWVEIVYKSDADLDLANQIEVTVKTDSDHTVRLKEGLVVGSASDPVGVLAKTEDEMFVVNVKFLDDEIVGDISNDDAKGQEVNFDLVVHAIQVIEE